MGWEQNVKGSFQPDVRACYYLKENDVLDKVQ